MIYEDQSHFTPDFFVQWESREREGKWKGWQIKTMKQNVIKELVRDCDCICVCVCVFSMLKVWGNWSKAQQEAS